MRRTRSEAQRLAWRWGAAATLVTAGLVYGAGAALHHDVAQTTVSFVLFAGLFGGTAAFLGAEVARHRRCPRCGEQQTSRPALCPECGYDVAARPAYVCSDGHRSFEPGVCGCGRRRQEWVAPDVAGHVKRSVYVGAAILVALVVTGLVLGG